MADLTRDEFVAEIFRAVPARFPLVKLAAGDEPFSVCVNGFTVALENLYRAVVLNPADRDKHIDRWIVELLRISEGAPDRAGNFAELKDRILPMVMSDGKAATAEPLTFTQPLVTGLHVAYAIDSDRSIAYIPRSQLDGWGVSPEALHDAAIENLLRISEQMEAQAAQDEEGRINLIIFQCGDGYDASRILLPTLHERLCGYLGSPFLAAIPNRDILLCFRNDPATATQFREQVKQDHARMPHQVTDELFLITPDGVAPAA